MIDSVLIPPAQTAVTTSSELTPPQGMQPFDAMIKTLQTNPQAPTHIAPMPQLIAPALETLPSGSSTPPMPMTQTTLIEPLVFEETPAQPQEPRPIEETQEEPYCLETYTAAPIIEQVPQPLPLAITLPTERPPEALLSDTEASPDETQGLLENAAPKAPVSSSPLARIEKPLIDSTHEEEATPKNTASLLSNRHSTLDSERLSSIDPKALIEEAEALQLTPLSTATTQANENKAHEIIDTLHQHLNDVLSVKSMPTQDKTQVKATSLPERHLPQIEATTAEPLQRAPYQFKIDTYQAKLKVYPQDLGEIHAEIKIDTKGTSLHLDANHQQVKEWLQTQLHGLKEAFKEANINLIDLQMGQRESPQKDFRDQAALYKANALETDGLPPEGDKEPHPQRTHNALVDTYA